MYVKIKGYLHIGKKQKGIGENERPLFYLHISKTKKPFARR